MPWIKISSEVHKDMKQYLVDINDVNLGDLVEASFQFCMENLESFEKFIELEEPEENKEDDKDDDEEDDKDDGEKEDVIDGY